MTKRRKFLGSLIGEAIAGFVDSRGELKTAAGSVPEIDLINAKIVRIDDGEWHTVSIVKGEDLFNRNLFTVYVDGYAVDDIVDTLVTTSDKQVFMKHGDVVIFRINSKVYRKLGDRPYTITSYIKPIRTSSSVSDF